MRIYLLLAFVSFLSIACVGVEEPIIEDLICVQPDQLRAINMTETSAVTMWNHPDKAGGDTEFTVEYGLKGFELGKGSTSETTNYKDIILIELESATEYQFYVRTECANGITALVAGPIDFITD